jgi:hypothetical protein
MVKGSFPRLQWISLGPTRSSASAAKNDLKKAMRDGKATRGVVGQACKRSKTSQIKVADTCEFRSGKLVCEKPKQPGVFPMTKGSSLRGTRRRRRRK